MMVALALIGWFVLCVAILWAADRQVCGRRWFQ